jgi:hypothetical protein
MLLVRTGHTHLDAVGQVRPAAAPAGRVVGDGRVRSLPPGQVGPRRAGLLAAPTLARLATWRWIGRRCAAGRSSVDGGIDEFPLLREINRSSRSTRACSWALSARSCSICRACSATSATRRSRGISLGCGTGPDQQIQLSTATIRPVGRFSYKSRASITTRSAIAAAHAVIARTAASSSRQLS